MLMDLIHKYIGDVDSFNFTMTALFLTAIFVIALACIVSIFSGTAFPKDSYNTCVMNAINQLDRSSDIISLCKELK